MLRLESYDWPIKDNHNFQQPYRHKVGEVPVFINECKHPSQPKVLFVFLTFRALKVRVVLVFNLKRTLESNGFLTSVFDVLAVFSVVILFFAFLVVYSLRVLFPFSFLIEKSFVLIKLFFSFSSINWFSIYFTVWVQTILRC